MGAILATAAEAEDRFAGGKVPRAGRELSPWRLIDCVGQLGVSNQNFS